MSEKLVRKVTLAALRGERGEGGWLKIDAPGATDKEISLAVLEAAERGLVNGCDCTHLASTYPEWRLLGPTGATESFIRDTQTSKRLWAVIVGAGAILTAFLAWLIPVVISLWRK